LVLSNHCVTFTVVLIQVKVEIVLVLVQLSLVWLVSDTDFANARNSFFCLFEVGTTKSQLSNCHKIQFACFSEVHVLISK